MSKPTIRVRKQLTRIEPNEAKLPYDDPESGYGVEQTWIGKRTPPSQSLCDIPLFMHEEVYKGILDYASHRTDIEVGGALLGRYCADRSRKFLVVECVFHLEVGPYCTRSHLEFPHEFIWALDDYMTAQKHTEPHLLRLGFYHTHPGYGIFLSQTDLDTFASFFSAGWHVAMVVDPVNRDEGVFYLRGDRLSPKCPVSLLIPHDPSRDRQFSFPRSFNSRDIDTIRRALPLDDAGVDVSERGDAEPAQDDYLSIDAKAPETTTNEQTTAEEDSDEAVDEDAESESSDTSDVPSDGEEDSPEREDDYPEAQDAGNAASPVEPTEGSVTAPTSFFRRVAYMLAGMTAKRRQPAGGFLEDDDR